MRGAKNLIVPSRSGTASQRATQVVNELTKQGVAIATPIGDVSSKKSLFHVLEEYSLSMPPVRGCINVAMVLNVSNYNLVFKL